ncbi:iron-sulfur cluster assembly accessory protein [Geminicoccaceae bacterium 1502E]|nr:iron-sulfur cluster assembly accessory protein [Geminicoccaceae bacterium 1502E]
MDTQQIISLTPAAAGRVRELLARQEDACGIRLGVKTTGCSGYSYQMDFARAVDPQDEVLEMDGLRILVAPDAAGMLQGTEIDFVESKLGAQFVFNNPKEKARCGCGESFSV